MIALIAFGEDAPKKEKKEKVPKVKEGWRFGGALPATTYDSNLGFQYGALFEFFNYGKPSIYPDFLDHTYTEVSTFTKGSGIYRFMYESNHLIGNTHFSIDLSYLPDKAYDFYGFNGYKVKFNKDWMDDESPDYKSQMFYRLEKNQFRIKADIQGKLSGDHLKWSAGIAFNNFTVSSVDIANLNEGKDPDELLPSIKTQPGLYEIYRDSLKLITANEADGGWVNTVKAGIMWDSRDNRPNPMKGIWTEMGIEYAPGLMGNDWSFARLYFIHRQYFTLIKDDLAFVYRLGYQTKLGGDVPFFYQSQVITSMLTGATSEGLGGSSSLRGVLRNRVIGDGFFYGNVELRWKPLYFKFLKADWYIGWNAFYDFGIITDKINMPSSVYLETYFNYRLTGYDINDFFNSASEGLHQSVGTSIMFVANRNFCVAVDIGKAFKAQDSNKLGFSIGLNYLF
jgi:outer membrane protein assembly factor BamA